MKQRYCLWLPSTCRPLVTRDDAKWHLPPWGRRGISSRNCVVTSWLWTLASNKTGTSNCQSDKLIYLYTCIHIYIYKYVYRYIDIYMDRVIHLHTHTPAVPRKAVAEASKITLRYTPSPPSSQLVTRTSSPMNGLEENFANSFLLILTYMWGFSALTSERVWCV